MKTRTFSHKASTRVQIFDSTDPATARVIATAPVGDLAEITGPGKIIMVGTRARFTLVPVRWQEVEGWVNSKWLRGGLR